MNNARLILADALDITSYVLLQTVTTEQVLNWIYTILLIISLLMGIVIKIISAVKDGRITKEEAEEIHKAVNEAKDIIKEESKENKK